MTKAINKTSISQAVVSWFSKYGRTDLPWQINPTPYRVWVSEIMLQQTQVNTVIPYYLKFMATFPSLEDLANGTDEQVMSLWSGLGYYSRARNLHKTAKILIATIGSEKENINFPMSVEDLQALPGIGRSTAGAILALAMNQKATILDGNVKRVLARCFAISGWPGKTSVADQLWDIAEQLTPDNNIQQYTQAMMDLGATICTRTKPKCVDCPLVVFCVAHQNNNPTDYPGKKLKIKIPTKHQNFYLLTNNKQQILMEKRPPTGIWGGLWTPISCNNDENGEEYLLQNYSIEIDNSYLTTEFRHTFSHFHLQIYPVHGNIKKLQSISENYLCWDSIDNWLEKGIPAAVRTMLLAKKKAMLTTN